MSSVTWRLAQGGPIKLTHMHTCTTGLTHTIKLPLKQLPVDGNNLQHLLPAFLNINHTDCVFRFVLGKLELTYD